MAPSHILSSVGRFAIPAVERKKLLWEWATQGVGGTPVAVHEVVTRDDDVSSAVKMVEIKGDGADVQESMAESEHAPMSDSFGNESSGTGEEDAASEEEFATVEPDGRSTPWSQIVGNGSVAAVGVSPECLAATLTPQKSGAEDMVQGENDGEGGAFGSPLSVALSSTHASPEKRGSGTDQSPPELTGSPLRTLKSGEPGREDGAEMKRIVPVRKIWAQEADGVWEAERMRSLRDPARPVRSPNARHRTGAASSELPHGNGDDKFIDSLPKAAENLLLNPSVKKAPDSDQHMAVASPSAKMHPPVLKVGLEPAPRSDFSSPPTSPSDQPWEVPCSQVSSPPVPKTQLSWEAQRMRDLRSPKTQPEAADQVDGDTSLGELSVMSSAVTTAGSGESLVQEVTAAVVDTPEPLIHEAATPSLADSTSSLPGTAVSPLPLVADSAYAVSEPRSIAHSHVTPEPPASLKASGETHEVASATPNHPSPTVSALARGSPRKARKTWMIGPEGRSLARSNNSLSNLPEDPREGGGGGVEESAGSISLQGDAMEMKVAREGVVREREELERQWKEGREELDRAAQMARALKTAVESLAKAHVMRSESQLNILATTSPAQSGARRTRTATSASTTTSASTASASSLASSSQHSLASGSKRHKRGAVLKSGGEGDHSGVVRWLAQEASSEGPTPSQSVVWSLPGGSVSEEAASSPVPNLKWDTCSEAESVSSASLPGNFRVGHQPIAPAMPRKITATWAKSGERRIGTQVPAPSPQSSPTDHFTPHLPPTFDGESTSQDSEPAASCVSVSPPTPQPNPNQAAGPTPTPHPAPPSPLSEISTNTPGKETNEQPPSGDKIFLGNLFSPANASMPRGTISQAPNPSSEKNPSPENTPPPSQKAPLPTQPGFWPQPQTGPPMSLPFPPLPPPATPNPLPRQAQASSSLPTRNRRPGAGMVGRRLPSFWPASDTEDEAPPAGGYLRGQSGRPARIGAGWGQVRNRGQTQGNHGQPSAVRPVQTQYPPLVPRAQPHLNPTAQFGPKETRFYPGQKLLQGLKSGDQVQVSASGHTTNSHVAHAGGPTSRAMPEMISQAVEESMREGKQNLSRLTGMGYGNGYQSELSPPRGEGTINSVSGMGGGGGGQREGGLGDGGGGGGWGGEQSGPMAPLTFSQGVPSWNPTLQARVQDQILEQMGGLILGGARMSLSEKLGAELRMPEGEGEGGGQSKFGNLDESGEWREAIRRGQKTLGGAVHAGGGGVGGRRMMWKVARKFLASLRQTGWGRGRARRPGRP